NEPTVTRLGNLCGEITRKLREASQEEVEGMEGELEIFFCSNPGNLTSYVVSEGEGAFLVLNLKMIEQCGNTEDVAAIIALALGYEIASKNRAQGEKQEALTPEQEIQAVNFAVGFLLRAGYGTQGLIRLLTRNEETKLVTNLTRD